MQGVSKRGTCATCLDNQALVRYQLEEAFKTHRLCFLHVQTWSRCMAHNPSSCPHILPMINNIFHHSSNLTRVPSSISDRLSSLHEYTTN
jgi:hypothetical protein